MLASASRRGDGHLLLELREAFQLRYGVKPQIFRAPGRVNLIGEHTDYNDGFVMPAALQFSTLVAIGARTDRQVAVYSTQLGEVAEFSLDKNTARPTGHWSDYVRGVAGVLCGRGIPISGANVMIGGDLPIGSGLGSSASLEVSCALAFLASSKASMGRTALAESCQRAEHEYVGTQCGIMDQFAACFGNRDKALMLDCRSLKHEYILLDPKVRIVICNTRIRHELATSEYNRRRSDCESGAHFLAAKLAAPIRSLRDVSVKDLERCREDLPEVIYRRCRHVVTENARVQKAGVALRNGDMCQFGTLMYESHRSLRDDYEVSCSELDLMVDLAKELQGVYGARMTGGGFGGCTVNLVHADSAETFKEVIQSRYERLKGVQPEIYVCKAADGAGHIADLSE
jgi:galactokinase